MPSARDCADRLREQAYKTLLPQVQALEDELQQVRHSLSNGIEQIEHKIEALRRTELPAMGPALEEILEDSIRKRDFEGRTLSQFVQDITLKETQEEILTLLLDAATACFPRLALFALRNERLIGWSSRGFSETAAVSIGEASFPPPEQFKDALSGSAVVQLDEWPYASMPESIPEESQGPWRICPLRVLDRTVALLVAGGAAEAPVRPEALSILTHSASLRLENIALKIMNAYHAASATAPPPAPAVMPLAMTDAAPEEAVPVEAEDISTPEPSAPEAVAEPQPLIDDLSRFEAALTSEETHVETAAPEESDIEILETEESEEINIEVVESGETAVEAVESEATAVEAVEAEESEVPAVDAERARYEAEPLAQPPEPEKPALSAEDEKLHTDAKRFARLLVSEIKLYNENHVVEGRKNRDLYIRLKRDIDRSRDMYIKRVSPKVADKIDYFHDEIIRILGNNDPDTLGSDYPGPRLESH